MPYPRIRPITLFTSLALFAGCGGEPPVVDTAETIRNEPAKPATEPTKPATEPAKAAPEPAPETPDKPSPTP